MTNTNYIGVSKNGRCKTYPFRGQINTRGTTHYLGGFFTEKEAAKAYDNAAYYLHKDYNDKLRVLNFPGDYEDTANLPQPAKFTFKLFSFCMVADSKAAVKEAAKVAEGVANSPENLRRTVCDQVDALIYSAAKLRDSLSL